MLKCEYEQTQRHNPKKEDIRMLKIDQVGMTYEMRLLYQSY